MRLCFQSTTLRVLLHVCRSATGCANIPVRTLSTFRGSSFNKTSLLNYNCCYSSGLISKKFYCKSSSAIEGSNESSQASKETNDASKLFDNEDEYMTLHLSDEELQELTNGDEELIKRVRYIQLEHEMLRQEGYLVPTKPLSVRRWRELIVLSSKSKRTKYYLYMFKTEKSKENNSLRKEAKKKQREDYLKSLPDLPPLGQDPDGTIYGLNRNTLTLRLRDETENRFYFNRFMLELRFGQQIVFDLGFHDRMQMREQRNAADQLELCYAWAKVHDTPFYINLCNVDKNTHLYECLLRKIPTLERPEFPMTVTEKSYLDLFPKESLVYLTPDAKQELSEFNSNDIYIIGGIIDRAAPKPYTLAKAKKENIRTAKLPLDRYLDWGMGSKDLTLEQMMRIMLDLRKTNDWAKALEHIPRRKLKQVLSEPFDEPMFRRSNPRLETPPTSRRQQFDKFSDSYAFRATQRPGISSPDEEEQGQSVSRQLRQSNNYNNKPRNSPRRLSVGVREYME